MKLILPWPDSRLLPNRKLDRWTKAQATRESRQTAWAIATDFKHGISDSCPRQDRGTVSACELAFTWYPRNGKVPDWVSLARATKPLEDGLVDAGILLDDDWKCVRGVYLRLGPPDKDNPRTEIEIQEV